MTAGLLLDQIFHALSHQVRREMLRHLTRAPYRVTELAEKFEGISLNAVSKHIKTLERAGLVERRKDGRVHNLTLNATPLKTAGDEIAFFQKFWETQLDQLSHFLESTVKPNNNNTKK